MKFQGSAVAVKRHTNPIYHSLTLVPNILVPTFMSIYPKTIQIGQRDRGLNQPIFELKIFYAMKIEQRAENYLKIQWIHQ